MMIQLRVMVFAAGLFWEFFCKHQRCKEVFFFVDRRLQEEEWVRLALGMYAFYRIVSHYRHNCEHPNGHNLVSALRIWAAGCNRVKGGAETMSVAVQLVRVYRSARC